MAYAERTTVSPEKSRAEIERILSRFGASHFMYAFSGDAGIVQFRAKGDHGYRQVRFVIPMPDENEYKRDKRGYFRTPSARKTAWEQEIRRRWRSLALNIKAKLDAVESGLFTFDQEFMPFLVLPDGSTVDEWLQPQITEAYESGQVPSEMRLAIPERTG